MAWIIKLKNRLQGKQAEHILITHEVNEAELALIRHVQRQHFYKEKSHLEKSKTVRGGSQLRKLSPQLWHINGIWQTKVCESSRAKQNSGYNTL